MTWWLLLIFISFTWLLWAVAGVFAKDVSIRRRECPPNSGFSLAPVIPAFPLIFFGAAKLVDVIAQPWGTQIAVGIHALLCLAFLASILRDLIRLFAARSNGAP